MNPEVKVGDRVIIIEASGFFEIENNKQYEVTELESSCDGYKDCTNCPVDECCGCRMQHRVPAYEKRNGKIFRLCDSKFKLAPKSEPLIDF